jgi:uncharacterized protein
MRFVLSSKIILFLLALNSSIAFAQPANSLSPKDFETASNKKEAVIVDVRTPAEWRKGIITGSRLQNVLEKDSFKTAISNWDRSKIYLLYCRSGKRSQLALEEMKALGFDNVYDLAGGFLAWEGYTPSNSRKILTPLHRVVIQVSSNDTLAWKGLMNNLKHLHEGWQYTAEMKVIAHGPGLDLLRNDKSTQQEKISKFSQLGIQFIACENTMAERKISKEQIVKEADFVKMGIGEVVRLQEEGWSYIKAGF